VKEDLNDSAEAINAIQKVEKLKKSDTKGKC
jgi:hypothetical protein